MAQLEESNNELDHVLIPYVLEPKWVELHIALRLASLVPRLLARYGESGTVPYISLWSAPA